MIYSNYHTVQSHTESLRPGLIDTTIRFCLAKAAEIRECMCAAFDRTKNTDIRREGYYLEIVERNADVISKICRSFATCDADYEDLRQDALLNIWRGVSGFRKDSGERTWIYRITLNTCVSTYRKRSRRKDTVSIDTTAQIAAEEYPEQDESVWLAAMVAQLPPMDHAIIEMWLDEFSYDEIASVMGMNRNTVATRIHRTKNYLKNKYQQTWMTKK